MTRLLAALGAVLLLAGCTSTVDGRGTLAEPATPAPGSSGRAGSPPTGGSAAPAAPAQPEADFTDCTSSFRLDALQYPAGRRQQISIGCATIRVPLDYSRPDGPTITLQLVRVRSSAGGTGGTDKRQLLVNPGGPGASGIETAVSLSAQLSDRILDTFDLVGFDPRGVGLSSPITCLTDAQKDELNAASPDVLTAAGFAEAKQDAAEVAKRCSDRYGSALAQYDTVNTARDMDQIRQAVGAPALDYLGFSYGTELGAQYAHLYPGRVRALVLDGAVNPTTDDITSFADQIKGFEDSFDQFAAYCRRTSPCSELGDPRRAVYRIAATAPLRSSTPGETRRVTSSLVYLGVLQALYSQSLWPRLAQALRSASAGDGAGLLDLADQYNQRVGGRYVSNISDANTTINCNDSEPGPSDATIRATARSWQQRFPMFGLWSAPSLFSCQQWQPDRNPPPLPTANTARTVLVVGNVNDPATPYEGAVELARTMGRARLLTWVGQGHTSYLQGSTCIDDAVDAYLVSGTMPSEGKTCRT